MESYSLVVGVTVEVFLVETSGDKLKVATTTVKTLLALDGELEHKILALVGELVESSGDLVESVIRTSLDTLVIFI